MKRLSVCIRIFAIVTTFSYSFLTLAQEVSTSVSTVKLVKLFRDLVRDVDPMAQVSIQEIHGNKSIKLPGTPFVASGEKSAKRYRDDLAEQLNIVVMTQSGELDASMTQLIKGIAGNYAAKINIKIQKISDELLAAQQAAVNATSKNQGNMGPSSLLDAMIQNYKQLDIRRYVFVTLGFVSLITIFLPLLWLGLHISVQRRMLKELREGFRSLSATIELSQEGQSRSQGLQSMTAPGFASAQTVPMLSSSTYFAEMTDDGLFALFTDCYWTHQDQYGSYLSHRIPVSRKIKMIERMPELGDYVAFVAQLPEVNLGFEQDSSFLASQPIWHLDMDAVSDYVKLNPAALHVLSPLRLVALKLRPAERLDLYEQAEDQSTKSFEWPNARSAARTLKKVMRMQINSEDEEREILSMPHPSLELIEQVPSLGWVLRLPQERITALLQSYSARDLASAWIAPPETLDQLKLHINAKKLGLMEALLEKTQSSRTSYAFGAIHQATVSELKKISLVQEEDGAVHVAA